MILLIDNYDSFSYNLYQLVGALKPDIQVIRNNQLEIPTIQQLLEPEAIIISPGPGRPCEAGRCIEIIQQLDHQIPILGVCLGHQAICEAYGATITYAKKLMHGKQSDTRIDTNTPLFAGLPETIPTARYHSLAVDEPTLPDCLKVTARAEDGEIMAIQHEKYPVFGLQFHPESILTPHGSDIIQNFLEVI